MYAYLLFGSYEYTDGGFYGPFKTEEAARAKLRAMNVPGNDIFDHIFHIRLYDMFDGSYVGLIHSEENVAYRD